MHIETDTTWSSIEGRYSYSKVVWNFQKNGIPVFTLLDENGDKISINITDENL